VLEPAMGLHGEILVQIEPCGATRMELRLRASAGGQAVFPVAYDSAAGRLVFGDKQADFRLDPGENALNLRLFIDGCIGELYVNDRVCFSNILPFASDTTSVSLLASGGTAHAKHVALWDMDTIWIE